MMVSFAQLFKAYSAFNNDGVAVTPRIVDYLSDKKGNHYTLDPKVPDLQAISKKAANQIHKILIRVVQDKKGTGRAARYPGLEIGGKTGTAHTVKNGHYVREYHSSFYGFANDNQGNRYTIGVLVIKAKKWRKYFASKSAVPTFRNIVQILVEEGYLKPDEIDEENQEQKNIYEIKPNIITPTPIKTQNIKPKTPTTHKPKQTTPKIIKKPKVVQKTKTQSQKHKTNIFDTIKTKPKNNKPVIKSKPKPTNTPKPAPTKPKPITNYEDLF